MPTQPLPAMACPFFANLIKDRKVSKPNEVWVGDLTYVRTGEDFLYLALLTDKHSRKIVGYHCGDTLEAMGCIKALEMALADLGHARTPSITCVKTVLPRCIAAFWQEKSQRKCSEETAEKFKSLTGWFARIIPLSSYFRSPTSLLTG